MISQNGLRITYLPQMPDFPKGAIVQDYVADGKWQKDWSTESEARNILNKLGITEHDVPVEQLSGGQKKRVALARTLVNPSDVLILDEPTNHLDITSKEILEEALNNYEGTVLYVSHDRYFINKTATRILDLTNHKLVKLYRQLRLLSGKKGELTDIYAPEVREEVYTETVSATKMDWKQQKEEQARLRKRENDLKKTERPLKNWSKETVKIDEEMAKSGGGH